MTQEELTSRVAMLSQEPPLLPVSIKDNIAYGLKPGAWVCVGVCGCGCVGQCVCFGVWVCVLSVYVCERMSVNETTRLLPLAFI